MMQIWRDGERRFDTAFEDFGDFPASPANAPQPVAVPIIAPVTLPPSVISDTAPRALPTTPAQFVTPPAPTYAPPPPSLFVADVSTIAAPTGSASASAPVQSSPAPIEPVTDTPDPGSANAGKWLAALAAAVMFLN